MKEEQIQKTLVQYARLKYKDNCLCFSIPNEHYTNPVRGKKLNEMGRLTGVPDLLFIKKSNGMPKYMHLELKAEKGRLSPSQISTIENLNKYGCNVKVAYGIDHAILELDKFIS